MDPISTLSLVASTFQIADFLYQLVAGTKKIYRNGAPKDHGGLATIAIALQKLHEDIKRSRHSQVYASQEVKNIAYACQESAIELIGVLDSLKGKKQTVWESFRVALRAVLKKEEVERLTSQISGLQGALVTHLQYTLL
jgi:hypothetical protein